MRVVRGLLLVPALKLLNRLLKHDGNSVIIGGPLGWTWEDTIDDAHHGSLGGGLHTDSHDRQHDHSLADDGSPIALTGVPSLPASKITSGVFGVVRGGTGLNTIALGGILYASALDVLSRIAPTAANQVLKSTAANALQIAALLAADIPNLDAAKITSGRFGVSRLGWTSDKLLKGAGVNADPTEIDAAFGLAIFGDGSDSNVTISGNTTLTRDMFYNNLTVNAGITLTTAGYRIFVKGTLTNNGTISCAGNTATDATGAAALASGSLGGSAAGGNGASSAAGGGGSGGGVGVICAKILTNNGIISAKGGNGWSPTSAAASAAGFFGGSASPSLGASGGAGGAASGSAGGVGGTATAPTAAEGGYRYPRALLFRLASAVTLILGGAGGGGGGSWQSAIAGGGGGGGGALFLIYNSITAGTLTVSGGTGGTGYGGGASGVTGSTGTLIQLANA